MPRFFSTDASFNLCWHWLACRVGAGRWWVAMSCNSGRMPIGRLMRQLILRGISWLNIFLIHGKYFYQTFKHYIYIFQKNEQIFWNQNNNFSFLFIGARSSRFSGAGTSIAELTTYVYKRKKKMDLKKKKDQGRRWALFGSAHSGNHWLIGYMPRLVLIVACSLPQNVVPINRTGESPMFRPVFFSFFLLISVPGFSLVFSFPFLLFLKTIRI